MYIELKLQFIPILSDLKENERITLSKDILATESSTTNQFVILSILFNMVQDLQGIFETYDNFVACIKNLEDDKIYELLYEEYAKPKAVTDEWVQQLLLDKLNKEESQILMILYASGEHLAEWPEQCRKEFLEVI